MTTDAELRGFIARFTPEVASLARGILAKMKKRLPSANRLVYDNYNALAIGFGPTERASDAIVSVAIYPRGVNLCLLQAGRSRLRDPRRLLQGSGTTNRFIPIKSAADIDDGAVEDLLAQALAAAKVPLDPAAKGRLIIKSVSAKQRPRRPGES